ncbi:hypothetical protein CH063_15593, partial [Colletotrichum higginsianum]
KPGISYTLRGVYCLVELQVICLTTVSHGNPRQYSTHERDSATKSSQPQPPSQLTRRLFHQTGVKSQVATTP